MTEYIQFQITMICIFNIVVYVYQLICRYDHVGRHFVYRKHALVCDGGYAVLDLTVTVGVKRLNFERK